MVRDTIDSHSSQINNKRLQMLFFNIDQLAPLANNSLHFNLIHAYFNSVKQLYMNVKSILGESERKNADKQVTEYYDLITEIEENPKLRTKSSLRKLITITEEFNFIIMNSLHAFDYFFRVGSRQQKGLTNINFHSENVFSASKGGSEDENQIKEEN